MGDGLRSVSTLNYNFNIGKNNVFSALLGNEVLKSDSNRRKSRAVAILLHLIMTPRWD